MKPCKDDDVKQLTGKGGGACCCPVMPASDLFLLKRIGTWPTCAFIGQSVSSNASRRKRERAVPHARLAECAGNNSNQREININGVFYNPTFNLRGSERPSFAGCRRLPLLNGRYWQIS